MVRFNGMLTLVLLAAFAGGCGLIDKKQNKDVSIPVLDLSDATDLESVVNQVTMDQDNPTFSFSGAGEWGPIIMQSVIAEAAGDPPIFQIDGTGMTFTGGDVSFSIAVTSTDELFFGGMGGTEPPDECENIVLDSATATEDSLPNAIETCLKAWATANGYPNDMAYTVTGSAIAKGGLPTPYSYSQQHLMRSEKKISRRCGTFKLPNSVLENIDSIAAFENTVFTVNGGLSEGSASILWIANVNADEGPQSGASGISQFAAAAAPTDLIVVTVPGNLRTATEEQVMITGTHVADVHSDQGTLRNFVLDTVNGLTKPGGIGSGCGTVFGEPPRAGSLSITLETTAVIDVL